MLRLLARAAKAVVGSLLLLTLAAQAPLLHKRILTYYVGNNVVMLRGLLGGGTGFQVMTPDGPRIITNAHVCEAGLNIGMLSEHAWKKESRVFVEVIKIDPAVDLCMLEGREDLGTLSLGFFSNDVLDRVFVLGHPYLESLSLDEGLVTGFEWVLGVDAVSLDADIFPGNSGSPAVNFFGQVVGVIFAGSPRSHHAFFVPLESLKSFIGK